MGSGWIYTLQSLQDSTQTAFQGVGPFLRVNPFQGALAFCKRQEKISKLARALPKLANLMLSEQLMCMSEP